jgi:type II secretory ATPase GspE/PulE/Tfp pilus assembly ATPase PilB-like protein
LQHLLPKAVFFYTLCAIIKIGEKPAHWLVKEEKMEEQGVTKHVPDRAVVSLVNRILLRAIELKADEIYVGPDEEGIAASEFAISYLVNGKLYSREAMMRSTCVNIIAHFKELGRLNHAKRDTRQEGDFLTKGEGREWIFRITVEPAPPFGEKVIAKLVRRS